MSNKLPIEIFNHMDFERKTKQCNQNLKKNI